ncbi:hypothetical protein C8R45DRAFT_1150822, partial [Mycena sanguinolenta]
FTVRVPLSIPAFTHTYRLTSVSFRLLRPLPTVDATLRAARMFSPRVFTPTLAIDTNQELESDAPHIHISLKGPTPSRSPACSFPQRVPALLDSRRSEENQFHIEVASAPHIPLKVQASSRSLRSPSCSVPLRVTTRDSLGEEIFCVTVDMNQDASALASHIPLKGRTSSSALRSPSHSLPWHNIPALESPENHFHVDPNQDVPCNLLKVQTSSRSLRSPSSSLPQNNPAPDSPNLWRGEEDLTLCTALRSSECDLTACASASSKLNLKNSGLISSLPSSLGLPLLSELPEIPDWYEDEQELKQKAERASVTIPVLDTPQSEYYSFDEHSTSLGDKDVLADLRAGQYGVPKFSNVKPIGKPPQTMPPLVPSHHWCSPTQTLRRSFSFDLGDRRATEFPCMIPLGVGLGYGLGSPFSPSPISFPIDPDSDHLLHTQPAELQCASPPLSLPLPIDANVYLSPTPPSLRRREALAVWRPPAPSPPPDPPSAWPPSPSPSAVFSDSDDARSMPQPFPSTASIWVPDHPSSRVPRPSSPPPPPYVPRKSGEKTQVEMWTLEEQITIAVLQAMDSRDKRVAAAGQQGLTSSRLVPRSGTGNNVKRKSKISQLLGRIWRRRGGW